MLWLQGWDNAPQVAQASRTSWQRFNPGWVVQCLDLRTLKHFLPPDVVEAILGKPKEPEALSDQIRLELLHRYGGVWADATTICAAGLDGWLPEAMPAGFFAFANPGPDRLVSTWFIAAEKGAYIIDRWREASWAYWSERVERDSYFWVHALFGSVYENDPSFQALWDRTPQFSAVHRFHFGPNSSELFAAAPDDIDSALADPPAPVFKLTHKLDMVPETGSLFPRICEFAESLPLLPSEPKRRRVLVGWYGSFRGHGTIGDLRSLEAVVSHLVGRGHEVFHATADSMDISGAVRVNWREFAPAACDTVIFVCGPILLHHPETRPFFNKFSQSDLVGIGVSLLPVGHPNHFNPFNMVFARQGAEDAFGDVAASAPKPMRARSLIAASCEKVIGLALRGEQHEYGVELCMWRETRQKFDALTDVLGQHGPLRVVEIENHLLRSGVAPDEIEEQYTQCDLILTTRFHGAVMSLRQRVPFVALDHIQGGAKVYPLLKGLGWSDVYKAEDVDALDIIRRGLCLLDAPQQSSLVETMGRHVREANRTLAHLDQWLAGT